MAYGFDDGSEVPTHPIAKAAYLKEQKRLKRLERVKRSEARFLSLVGGGVAAKAKIKFGSELDLEGLSEEEQDIRATGRTTRATGLLL